jgi:hypothetical protein
MPGDSWLVGMTCGGDVQSVTAGAGVAMTVDKASANAHAKTPRLAREIDMSHPSRPIESYSK